MKSCPLLPHLATWLAVLLLYPVPSAACPRSCIFLSAEYYCQDQPAAQRASSPGYWNDYGMWDIPAGALAASTNNGRLGGSAIVQVDDVFMLQGVPPGTPAVLAGRFAVHVQEQLGSTRGADGSVVAVLANGAFDSTVVTVSASFPTVLVQRDTVLILGIPVTSGAPFPLRLTLRCASTLAFVQSEADLVFAGLPPGSRLTSCNGYFQAATPALSGTWGRVKAVYR